MDIQPHACRIVVHLHITDEDIQTDIRYICCFLRDYISLNANPSMRGQNHNLVCSVCERQSSVSPCRLCSSLIVSKKGQKWTHQIDLSLHDQAQQLLGGPNKTAQQRWGNLRKKLQSSRGCTVGASWRMKRLTPS